MGRKLNSEPDRPRDVYYRSSSSSSSSLLREVDYGDEVDAGEEAVSVSDPVMNPRGERIGALDSIDSVHLSEDISSEAEGSHHRGSDLGPTHRSSCLASTGRGGEFNLQEDINGAVTAKSLASAEELLDVHQSIR